MRDISSLSISVKNTGIPHYDDVLSSPPPSIPFSSEVRYDINKQTLFAWNRDLLEWEPIGGNEILVAEDQIAFGDADGGLVGDADFIRNADGLLLFNSMRIGKGAGANSLVHGNTSANSTGTNWLAQGFQAGNSSTIGSYWVAQGFQAGNSSTTGSAWLAQGYRAGFSNTTGISWVAQGNAAGFSNTTGSNWIAQGYEAGRYLTGTTTGANFSNSVYIGAITKVGAQNAINETVIGYAAEGVGSNTVTLGNTSVLGTYTSRLFTRPTTTAQRPTIVAGYLGYNSTWGGFDIGTSLGVRRAAYYTDVTPADGNILVYSTAGGAFVPAAFADGGGDLITVPTVVSAFTNDAGYITSQTDDQTATEVPFDGGVEFIADNVDAAIREVQGNIPTAVSELTNDAGYITDAVDSDGTTIINTSGTLKAVAMKNPLGNGVGLAVLGNYTHPISSTGDPGIGQIFTGLNFGYTDTQNFGWQLIGASNNEGNILFRTNNSGTLGSWRKIWNESNDGAASGLDADLLDGQQGSYYYSAANPPPTGAGTVTSVSFTLGTAGTSPKISGSPITSEGNLQLNLPTASEINTGVLSASNWTTFNNKYDTSTFSTIHSEGDLDEIEGLRFLRVTGGTNRAFLNHHTLLNLPNISVSNPFNSQIAMFGNNLAFRSSEGTANVAWNQVWHDNNDGAASELDADLLDGQQGSYYYSPANPPPPSTGGGSVQSTITYSSNASQILSDLAITTTPGRYAIEYTIFIKTQSPASTTRPGVQIGGTGIGNDSFYGIVGLPDASSVGGTNYGLEYGSVNRKMLKVSASIEVTSPGTILIAIQHLGPTETIEIFAGSSVSWIKIE